MIDGKWDITIDSPMGKVNATLLAKVEGNVLTGTLTDPDNVPIEIFDGTANGDEFGFTVKFKKPMPLKIIATGKVDGDSLTGQAKMPMGSSGFTGVRVQ